MDEGELVLSAEVVGKVLEPGRGGGGGAAMGGTPPGGDQAAGGCARAAKTWNQRPFGEPDR